MRRWKIVVNVCLVTPVYALSQVELNCMVAGSESGLHKKSVIYGTLPYNNIDCHQCFHHG